MSGYVATAQTDVAAAPERVWAALTEPEQIAAYMEGSKVDHHLGGRDADHLGRRVRRPALPGQGRGAHLRRAATSCRSPTTAR